MCEKKVSANQSSHEELNTARCVCVSTHTVTGHILWRTGARRGDSPYIHQDPSTVASLFLRDKGMWTRLPPRTPVTCCGQLFQPRRERWQMIHFLNGQVGPSILTWNVQNREPEINVKSGRIKRMHYHVFSFTAESIKSVSADWRLVVLSTRGGSQASIAYVCLCGGNRCNILHLLLSRHVFLEGDVYLSRCDGTSVQDSKQTAYGWGSDGGGSASWAPHQVGKHDVTQELLWLITKMSESRQKVEQFRQKWCRVNICIT